MYQIRAQKKWFVSQNVTTPDVVANSVYEVDEIKTLHLYHFRY